VRATWGAYAAFCALGLATRFVPAAFPIFVVFGVAFPLWWARRQHDFASIGLTRRGLAPALAWGVGAGIGWAVYTYLAFGGEADPPPLWLAQVAIGLLVWLAIMSPFQELFFRGWFQPRLQARLGRGWGLVLTATAFTVWHFFPPFEGTATASLPLTSPLGIASTFVGGLLFGYVHQRTQNVIAPWLAHALGGIGLVLIGRMVFLQYVP